MRILVIAVLALTWPVAVQANDWKKYYHPITGPEKVIAFAGDAEQLPVIW